VFRADAFDPGQPLEVTARHATGRTKRFAFECAVLDPAGGAPLVEGRLNLLAVELPEGMELPR
jgi:acyl-CoA thioesterase FadM